MRKIAKMQNEYFIESLKNDSDLLDLVFPPKLMSIEEAAEFTRIPISTIYKKCDEIPHEKVGKRLVFTDRGLIRWMKRCSRQDTAREVSLGMEKKKIM